MSDDHPTARDVMGKTHSYRNHTPESIIGIANNPHLGPLEQLQKAESALNFIESGRLIDFLEATYGFFFKLDRDEMIRFTQRNPDLVKWMSAYAETQEATNAFVEFRDRADRLLDDEGRRTDNAPPFDRRAISEDSLLMDMATRRRSYRNWTPYEFIDVEEMGKIEITRGFADEIGFRTVEIRDDIEFPIEVYAGEIGRDLFNRVEDGRFTPVANEGMTFFAPLDMDERLAFARRNPGIIMWISAFGQMSSLIHADQLFPGHPDVYPTLGEETG